MTTRAEITMRYARAFKAADKRTKGRILDEVVSVTGWSRDNARRGWRVLASDTPLQHARDATGRSDAADHPGVRRHVSPLTPFRS